MRLIIFIDKETQYIHIHIYIYIRINAYNDMMTHKQI